MAPKGYKRECDVNIYEEQDTSFEYLVRGDCEGSYHEWQVHGEQLDRLLTLLLEDDDMDISVYKLVRLYEFYDVKK